MGKKILIGLLLIMSLLLISCNTNPSMPKDGPKIEEIISDHIDSKDMYYKVKYPTFDQRVQLKNEYFETRFFPGLKQYLELLSNHMELNINDNIKTDDEISNYVNNFVNEKTVYIYSDIQDSSLKIYINENGKVLIKKDKTLYESKENALNYNRFCEFEVIDFLKCYDQEKGRIGINVNDYYFNNQYNIYYNKWYEDRLDKTTYEEAIANGISKEEYIKSYQYMLFEKSYKSYFSEHNYYYVLKLPFAYNYELQNLSLYLKYDVGLFGEKIYCSSYQIDIAHNNDIVYILTTNQGISVVQYNSLNDGYHLLGLDYLDIDSFNNLLSMNDDAINKQINDFKKEHGIE